MSEVFLSYKRDTDRAHADQIRAWLVKLGVKVFIDHTMAAGVDFQDLINKEIDCAKAVLVLWTNEAVESRWVRGEALRAIGHDILVATAFNNYDPSKLPSPFNTINTSDLSGWIDSGVAGDHPHWQRVLDALGTKLSRPGLAALAKVLDSEGVDADPARAAFAKDYPDDPASIRFREEQVARVRDEFEVRLKSEQEKFDRRSNESKADTRRRVEECKRMLKTRIAEYLARGGELWPPDPQEPFQDRVVYWRSQLQVQKDAADEFRVRAEQAEEAVAQKSNEVAGLKSQLESLTVAARPADAEQLGQQLENMLGLIKERNEKLALVEHERSRLNGELEARDTLLAARESEISRLEQSSRQERAASAEKEQTNAQLRDQAEQSALSFQETRNTINSLEAAIEEARRKAVSSRLKAHGIAVGAAAMALVVGMVIWQPLFGSGDMTSDIKKTKDDNEIIRTELLKAKEGGTRTAAELKNAVAELKKSKDEATSAGTELQKARTEASRVTGERDKLSIDVKRLDSLVVASSKSEAELKKQVAALTNDNVEQKKKLEQQAQLEIVRKCDDMTAFQFDPDRPGASGWKESHGDIDVAAAWEICEDALKTVSDQTSERRIKLQRGRIWAASGRAQAMAGNFAEAERAFKSAVDLWEQAAKMGSGHAHNVLGNYYQGQFSLANTPRGRFDSPASKNLARAWQSYVDAADLDNPIALATVGYGLMFPDWSDDWKTLRQRNAADERKGREYLEKASRSDYARTLYFMGYAMREGRGGYPREPEAAEALFAIAYCKGDAAAAGFYARNTSINRPACPR